MDKTLSLQQQHEVWHMIRQLPYGPPDTFFELKKAKSKKTSGAMISILFFHNPATYERYIFAFDYDGSKGNDWIVYYPYRITDTRGETVNSWSEALVLLKEWLDYLHLLGNPKLQELFRQMDRQDHGL